jgi:accessory gene regulator protein AgrB
MLAFMGKNWTVVWPSISYFLLRHNATSYGLYKALTCTSFSFWMPAQIEMVFSLHGSFAVWESVA